MLKKVALGFILIGLSAGLVIGAINRTSSKSELSGATAERSHRAASEGRNSAADKERSGYQLGQGYGSSGNYQTEDRVSLTSQNRGNSRHGQGGNGDKNEAGNPSRALQAEVDDSITLEGAVWQLSDDSLTMVLSDSEQILIEGRAWRFALESGFTTDLGHKILATGFYEDGEFKANTIVDLNTNLSINLRQDSGQPLWAGNGRRGT